MKNKNIWVIAAFIIGLFSGIAFIENWLVLHRNFPKSKYFEVPINPEAWGSIGEWVMILVTGFTAYFLVKTFIEQKKITELEYKKYVESNRPILNIINKDYQIQEQERYVSFEIEILNNSLQNLKISNDFHESYKLVDNHYFHDVILPNGHTIKFELFYTLDSVFIEIDIYTGNLINLNYEDIFGNCYLQQIFVKGPKYLFLHPPILLQSIKGKNK
ncbi:hypothetical protein [Sphingobacterium sp.]|uniref:hypothetical protein n=1 Tax=Sphingobacterium sp. TaxID=341027 RepID=UPI0028AB424A|nr:hypothetical protein [Sphingobacterium sp.]